MLLAIPILAQKNQEPDWFKNRESFGTYAIQSDRLNELPESVRVKYKANDWVYVLAEREEIIKLSNNGLINRIYFEPIGQQLMNDSARFTHFVEQVHLGQDLDFPYTGDGVILGYVDNGCDFNHLDFKDASGNSRILRYWDQGASNNFRTPTKYGYGRVFTNIDIDTGAFPNYSGSDHGTTVTGSGSGNGLANGRNKGMAPDSKIIVVKTNFNAPSWTLTVAEGVDYIFSVADSLGLPAVANLSVGTYLGSHDARDPAGLYIDSLLTDQEGRIVVCSAGNSGNWQPYHVRQELSVDTNFVWMIPNTNLFFGSPGVYFDLWADTSEIQNMYFAFGADKPGPEYRGNTSYKTVNFNINGFQNDTIWGANNSIIGSVLFAEQVVGPNYNLQAVVLTDSLSYSFRFIATGSGTIDLWSSTNIGGSNFSTAIPDTTLYPEFVNYMMPDLDQSIVSSWNCSDKVISVGNVHNRKNYIASNNTIFPTDGGTIPSGELSVTSSKGPTRLDLIKPEVVASGDMSLSARKLNSSYPANMLDIGAMHVRNGGTSMSGPVVAGIAALYLEKCPLATWENFRTDLINNTFLDSFSGFNLPNNSYGYGKAHALNTLMQTNFTAGIQGPELFCPNETQIEVVGANIIEMIWQNGDSSILLPINEAGVYYGVATNNLGCLNYSDTLTIFPDTISPAASPPDDYIVNCISQIELPNSNEITQSSDNCSVSEIIHLQDTLVGTACEQVLQRTYRVSDASGNFIDVMQQIFIIDTIAPTGAAPSDTLVSCSSQVPEVDTLSVLDANDNCSNVTIIYLSDVSNGASCPEIITRTYRLIDACGNFSDVQQIITVLDTIPPYVQITDSTLINCEAALPEPNIAIFDNYTITENCSIESIVFLSDNAAPDIENIIYRTYQLSDYCENTFNAIEVIQILELYPAPSLVSFDGNVLTASENMNYQWYLNNEVLDNQNQQSFMPFYGGFYTVGITDNFGCNAISEAYYVSLVGIEDFKNQNVSVFPNPTDGYIFFQTTIEQLPIILYDVKGSILLQETVSNSDFLDFRPYASGLYYIGFPENVEIKTIKIIKK